MSKNTDLVKEARNINASLRRVKQAMEVTVMQSLSASETVHQDGELIKETLNEQKYSLREALQYTGKTLRKMKWAQIMEKYSLFLSLCFYLLVVAYIVLKRTGILGLMIQRLC